MTNTMEKRYCINGYCVVMTEHQAALWNAGDFDWREMRGAYVVFPYRDEYNHPLEDFKPLSQAWKSSIFRSEVSGYPAEDSN